MFYASACAYELVKTSRNGFSARNVFGTFNKIPLPGLSGCLGLPKLIFSWYYIYMKRAIPEIDLLPGRRDLWKQKRTLRKSSPEPAGTQWFSITRTAHEQCVTRCLLAGLVWFGIPGEAGLAPPGEFDSMENFQPDQPESRHGCHVITKSNVPRSRQTEPARLMPISP